MTEQIDSDDKEALRNASQLLSFYGIQLQSHASQIVGLALISLGIFQAWVELGRLSPIGLPWYYDGGFSLLIGVIGSGLVYQVLRLYVYGKLANVLTQADEVSYTRNRNRYQDCDRDMIARPGWTQLSMLYRLTNYCVGRFMQSSALYQNWWVFAKSIRVNSWVLVGCFVGFFWVSYLLFGRSDGYLLVQSGAPVIAAGTMSGLLIGGSVWYSYRMRRLWKKWVKEKEARFSSKSRTQRKYVEFDDIP